MSAKTVVKKVASSVKPDAMNWSTFIVFALLFAFILYAAGNGSLVKYKQFLL